MRRSDLTPDVLAEYKRLQEDAMLKVQIAISRGLLPRVSTQHGSRPDEIGLIICVDCGQQAQHYDHRDYLEPLEVEPVCQSCNYKRGLAADTFTKHPEYWTDLKRRSTNDNPANKRAGGRPAKGSQLTPQFIRLDDEVFAECQRLGKEYGTINEGLRSKLLNAPLEASDVAISDGVTGRKVKPAQTWKRGPRPKGDRQR